MAGLPRTGLTIAETTEAIEFLITEMRKREAALDLRLVAKTYRSFRRWKQKKRKPTGISGLARNRTGHDPRDCKAVEEIGNCARAD